MRKFVFGSLRLFDMIYGHVTADTTKRLRYGVTLPGGMEADLRFSSPDGRTVEARLSRSDGAPLAYEGGCEFFDALAAGCLEFGNPAVMHLCFSQGRAAYEGESIEDAIRALTGGGEEETAERGRRKRCAIDEAAVAAKLKESVVGQDGQIDGIVGAVASHLRKVSPRKPAVIMLAGPTGVGKTETVRRLADILQGIFGKDSLPLISVNCNELREAHRVSQLLGSPAGYIGYDEPSMMEPLKSTDSAIILFDEYEKAHADVHTAVMTWMDTGKVTFPRIEKGEKSAVYDCAPSIIFLTSNIDLKKDARGKMGFGSGDGEKGAAGDGAMTEDDRCRKALVRGGLRPEIAARISRFFVFDALTDEDMKKIALIAFKAKFSEYGFVVDGVSDALSEDMTRNYTSSAFGVRPLEAALEGRLGRQLPPVPESETHIFVDGTVENLVFTEAAK